MSYPSRPNPRKENFNVWVIKEKKKLALEIETERTQYPEKRVRSRFKLHTKTSHLPSSQSHIGRNVVLNIDPIHLQKAHLTTRSL